MSKPFDNKKVTLGGVNSLFSQNKQSNGQLSSTISFSSKEEPIEVEAKSLQDLETKIPELADTSKIIFEIELSKLRSFPGHPFKIVEDDALNNLKNSIRDNGVLEPIIVRKTLEGDYFILSGHRRKYVCELLGLKTIPAYTVHCDDDVATNIMVDSNIARPEILPSEKAFAYKMKMEANSRAGARTDLTGEKIDTAGTIGALAGDSRTTVLRYLRLTKLETGILDLVDIKKISINVAADSYTRLSYVTQNYIAELFKELGVLPTKEQLNAIIKKETQNYASLTKDDILDILTDIPAKPRKVILTTKQLNSYFPPSYTEEKIQEVLEELLTKWSKENNTKEN